MPICIAGMHRSGTSMVARLLQVSGLYLGEEDELFAGRPDNPEGFFEHRGFYAVTDRILEPFDSTWDMPKCLPAGWENDPRLAPVYAEAKQLISTFEGKGEWGWKDPRNSLTLPFWRKLMPEMKVIVCLRNPVDVCASLTKRGYASQRFGFELWRTYMDAISQDALAYHIVTHYAAYFHDPESELRRVASFCGLSPNDDQVEAASATIDRKLRHSDSGLFDLIAAKADIGLIKQYFEACIASGPVFEKAFRDESITITQSLEKVDETRAQTKSELQEMEKRVAEARQHVQDVIEAKNKEIKAKEDALLAELHRNIHEGRERIYKTIETKDATIKGLEEYIKVTEEGLRNRLADLEGADTLAAQLSSELEAMKASRGWQIALKLQSVYRMVRPTRRAPALPAVTPVQSAPAATETKQAPVPEVVRGPKHVRELEEFAWVAAFEKQQVELSPQARIGRKLLPPGGFMERLFGLALRTKQVARQEGTGMVLKRGAAKVMKRPMPPVPPVHDGPIPTRGPSELLEIVRQDLVEAENVSVVKEQYERAVDTMLEKGFNHGPNYVPLDTSLTPPVNPVVKLIAFYLTQFHPIPENDKWWGKGFTEWTNVSKAVPVYAGQYQPHLPDELGFYDLRVKEVQERQVELAKMHGLYGFAFYYYWFAGKRLLEKPLQSFVENPKIDFPFCLIWANENWTRRWDGRQDDILMGQDHTPESDVRFIEDLRPFLEHKNYIRVDGRPIIGVYRAEQLPDPKHTAERWREYCLRNGLGNPLIVACQTFGFENPETIGFDAAMQFPPHNEHSGMEFQLDYRGGRVHVLKENYGGCICSYPALVGYKHNTDARTPYPLFETAFPMWDNTPRLPLTGVNFAFATPELYRIWLQKLCTRAIEAQPKRENRLVFINAWNEWAEGAHLEPDRRYGYGYLKATREALDYSQRVEEGALAPANIVLPPDEEMTDLLKHPPYHPILVYQIGKVGSRSIYEPLSEMDLPDPVLHLHLLNNLDKVSRNVCKRYPHPEGILFYLRRGQMVRDWMERATPETVFKIVTGVREPVAYNVSSFFEMLSYIVPNIQKRYEADDITVEELQELFLHQFDHKSPHVWFDDQFKPVFGIDVYEKEFPYAKGFDTYKAGNSEAVLIRVEDLSRTLKTAMAEFLGIDDFPVESRNRSEDKLYHDLAVRFKQRPLPEEYVDRMHSTKFAKHFYTEAELAKSRRRWTGIS